MILTACCQSKLTRQQAPPQNIRPVAPPSPRDSTPVTTENDLRNELRNNRKGDSAFATETTCNMIVTGLIFDSISYPDADTAARCRASRRGQPQGHLPTPAADSALAHHPGSQPASRHPAAHGCAVPLSVLLHERPRAACTAHDGTQAAPGHKTALQPWRREGAGAGDLASGRRCSREREMPILLGLLFRPEPRC